MSALLFALIVATGPAGASQVAPSPLPVPSAAVVPVGEPPVADVTPPASLSPIGKAAREPFAVAFGARGVVPRAALSWRSRLDRRTPSLQTVCGTTVIGVGSELDPRMVTRPPEDGPRPAVRRVLPPACAK